MKMPNQLLLLLLDTWLGANTAQAATPGSVVAWGDNAYGQSTVLDAAQSGVIAIAAGWAHTVALKDDGSLLAWGAMTANPNNLTNVPLAAQSGGTAIAASGDHTVVLKNDGSVVEWGSYGWGQSGVPLAAQRGVTAVAAGNGFTLALKSDGSVIAWDRFVQMLTVPAEVQSGVTAIAASGESSQAMALKADGSVIAWQREDTDEGGWGPIILSVLASTLSNIVAVSAGDQHFTALKNDGAVIWWDWNDDDLFELLPAQSGVIAIAAGYSQTLALKNDGTVLTWNGYGVPVPSGLSGVTAIAAGGGTGHSHSLAIFTPASPSITSQPLGQSVSAWQSASLSVTTVGYPVTYQWRKDGVNVPAATNATYSVRWAQTNHAGTYTVVASSFLGSVTSAPPVLAVSATTAPGTVVSWGIYNDVPVAAQSGVTAIAAGGEHTLALKNDGSVLAWGYNGDGQTTVPAAAQSGVTGVAAGFRHSVALKNDGSVVAWGVGTNIHESGLRYGQCIVPAAAMSGVKAIAAGAVHTVALKHDGSVIAWGDNRSGQTNVPITAMSGVIAIAAGGEHTLALKNDGSVVVWGITNSQTALPVNAQSGVAVLAPGGAMVLKNDGSVVAWGNNTYGQTDLPVPAQSGVTALAAGGSHSLGLKTDGTVVAWGRNWGGPVTGTQTPWPYYPTTAIPVTLEGKILSGVTALAAASYHSVALLGTAPLLRSLNARPSGNQLILSWPANATGFTLQSTLQLNPPAWVDVTNAPVLSGGNWNFTNSISGSNKFYRLRKP